MERGKLASVVSRRSTVRSTRGTSEAGRREVARGRHRWHPGNPSKVWRRAAMLAWRRERKATGWWGEGYAAGGWHRQAIWPRWEGRHGRRTTATWNCAGCQMMSPLVVVSWVILTRHPRRELRRRSTGSRETGRLAYGAVSQSHDKVPINSSVVAQKMATYLRETGTAAYDRDFGSGPA